MSEWFFVKTLDGGMQIFPSKEHAAKFVIISSNYGGIRIWDGESTLGWSSTKLDAAQKAMMRRLARWILSDSGKLEIAGYKIWRE